jgi:hypothetical protein
MHETELTPHESPLELAQRDWYVFPADHPDLPQCAGVKSDQHDPKTCDKRGKCPVIKWDTGASTSPHNIAYWFSGNPRNVGIHCGKSGLLVIDEDAPGAFAKFAADHGVTIPETYTVTTAKGKHYYFADTQAGTLGNREGAFRDYDINVRSGNGYVIAPGSKHASGITYTPNGIHTVAPLPDWVVEAIQGPGRTNGSDHQAPPKGFELPEVIKEGHRDEILYRFACSLRAQTLNYPTAKLLFQEAWKRCEHPPTAKTPFTWDQALAKLKGAYGSYDEGRSEGYEPAELGGSESTEGEFLKAVHDEVWNTKVRVRAREVIAEEDARQVRFPEFVRLDEFLAREDDAPKQLIRGVWNTDTPVLMAAQYKAGKTTIRDNVVKSLVDGYDFLDRFQVNRVTEGTIAILDLELSETMMREWLKDQNIKTQERVVVVPMRGMGASLNLMLPAVRQRWASRLKGWNCQVLILDCLRPVLDALGLSEDKDAGRFLNGGFDPLRVEAGVPNSMVIHHMGHAGDRARGDSSMLGWGDLWRVIRRDPDDPASERFFSAYGRDIDVPEGTLEFNGATRHLSLKKGSKADAEAMADWQLIKPWIKANQPVPSQNKVVKAFGRTQEENEPITERRVRKALRWGSRIGELHLPKGGQGVASELLLTELARLEDVDQL